jgi:hypothetical protein
MARIYGRAWRNNAFREMPFYDRYAKGEKVADATAEVNQKGCHVCGGGPVLRLVQRRGYCKQHVGAAFADARVTFEPMLLRGIE